MFAITAKCSFTSSQMLRFITHLLLLAVPVSANSNGAPCKVLNNTNLTPDHGAKEDYKLRFSVELFHQLANGDEERVLPQSEGGDGVVESGGVYRVIFVRDDQQSGFLLRAVDDLTINDKPPKDAGVWLDSYSRKCATRAGGLQSGIVECGGHTYMTHAGNAEENCPKRIEFMWQAPKPGVTVTFQAVGVFDWHTKHTYQIYGPFKSKLGDTRPECIDKFDLYYDYCNETSRSNPLEQLCLGPANIRSFCEKMCCGVEEAKPNTPSLLRKAPLAGGSPSEERSGQSPIKDEGANEGRRPNNREIPSEGGDRKDVGL